MSFREARESLSERNAAILSSRYPRYNQQVAQFCGANPLSRVHDRVWNFLQQAFIERRARVVLHILHNGPSVARNHALGGTELHVKGIIERESSSAHFSLVRSRGHLYLTAQLDSGDRVLVLSDEFKLSDLISPKFFSVVHLHHSLGFDSQSLFSALREHGNYVVSVHDYHLICNRFFLRTAQGEVCDGFKCNGTCGEVDGSNVQRRELARELFEGAGRIFVFSRSSKDIITRLGVPEQSMQLVQHGISKANGVLAPVPTKPSKAEPIKLVTVGTIVAHKGSELIKRLAGELNEVGGIPIEWHFIGRMEEHADGIISHGEYTAERLGSMLAGIAPHAAILLPHCQETYSLTLDELISRGVAVITGPFGALPERVLEWGVGYVCDYSVDGVKAVLQSMVSEWDKHLEIVSKTKIAPIRSAQAEVDHFGAQYKELGSSRPVRASALLEWLQPDLIRSKRTAKDAIKLFGKSAIIRAVKFVQHYETV
jgi:glycosyltransferase involved in cell wall biosynthesis